MKFKNNFNLLNLDKMVEKYVEFKKEELSNIEDELLALENKFDGESIDVNSNEFVLFMSKFSQAVRLSKQLDEISDYVNGDWTEIDWDVDI